VDLLGRLSNPPDTIEALAAQGVKRSREPHAEPPKQAISSPIPSESDAQETPGRLSNPPQRPVLRRLSEVEIDKLVCEYQAGRTLADLAAELGLHRRTVAAHLEARGVQRRVNRRKMTDDNLSEAARRYRAGDSLAKVASIFNIDAATVRRELQRAGVSIRPRRGWT
jgi:sulfur carrier protein ThiS